jgi:hypothetical protein
MGGTLLVTHQDMPKLGILRQGIIKRQNITAREAEHNIDSLLYQAFTYNLGTSLFHNSSSI